MKNIINFLNNFFSEANLKGKITYLFYWFFCIFFVNISFPSYTQITRAQIISNAAPYTTFTWTATSSNIWNGVSCGGKTVQTPSWVVIGTNTGMPYCWGGWTSTSSMQGYLNSGKSAGDMNTATSFGVEPSCAVGLDCSGLVSRAWALSSKYSTSTLPDISTSVALTQTQPGDILNLAGSHTRLIETNYGNGSYRVIESSATDWKTSYRTYTTANLSSYTPRVYNNVSGGGITAPSNDECSNAITLTPSTTVNNTSGDIAGATQSYTANGCASGLIQDVWYKFTATATGTYTIRLTPSSSMDGIVEVRQGSCSGTVLGCADSGGGNGGIENLNISVTNGTVYYVRVYEYNSAGNTTPPLSTNFNICVIGATTSECTITSLVPNAVTHGPASFSTTSGSDDIIVNGQANCNFNVTESCSWLTVTPMSGTTNSVKQAFLNYSIDANTTTSTRQCTFYVNGSPITITQNGCSFEFYPTTMNVPASGSTYNLDIYTSSPCSWNIQNNSSWAHPSQLSGTGYPTITVTVDPNTTCDTRTCTLTLSPGNQTHVITQPSNLIVPTTPTSVTASQMSIVNGQSSTLQVVGGALNSAPEWVWYTGSCGGTRIGAGSSIVVSPPVKTTYYVQASACGTFTTCKSITINNTTAVNDVSSSDIIKINPNPTTGKFEITGMELLGGNCKIEIFNHIGKSIYVSENENFGNKISLDLSSYPVGMYIVKLSNNGVSYQKKVNKK